MGAMDYDALRASLGDVIRSERYRKGFRSQEALAYASGLHPAYVGAIERGERNVSLRNLLRIATSLGMPLSGLIADAEELATSRGENRSRGLPQGLRLGRLSRRSPYPRACVRTLDAPPASRGDTIHNRIIHQRKSWGDMGFSAGIR